MSTPYEIPLTAQAQHFDVDLAGVNYQMRLLWNASSACWVLDIADTFGNPLVNGIPLVTGVDLLMQYRYLGFLGGLVVTVNAGIGVPDYAGLGTRSHLYFVTVP